MISCDRYSFRESKGDGHSIIGYFRLPRLPDQFLECSVYLYHSEEDAIRGEKLGGSGFILTALPRSEGDPHRYVYVVTNSHVVSGGANVIRINSLDGKVKTIRGDSKWAHSEEDDLAVLFVKLDTTIHKFRVVQQDWLLTENDIVNDGIGPGDDTFIVGRFINHEGKQKNIPTLRFGTIAMMPYEPIYNEEMGYYQESFLVETRTIQGYSGSPVFVYIPPLSLRPNIDKLEMEWKRPWLLGIDWCHILNREPVFRKGTRTEVGHEAQSSTGMMGVIPAWNLRKLLDREDLVEEREKVAKEIDATRPKAVELESVIKDEEESENPSHKEDFIRLLGKAVSSPPTDD